MPGRALSERATPALMKMRSLLVLTSLLAASGCDQDAEPPPPELQPELQPIPCGNDTCSIAQYCSGSVCDDIAQRMGQCTTIGTAYACISLPSSCADDATCDCLMRVNQLKNSPGATCVDPRAYTSFVF